MKLSFFGTRGSAPATGGNVSSFGGSTTCCLLQSDKTSVMVDAGTGVFQALELLKDAPELHLFITHPHLDHMAGLITLIPAFAGKKLHIYGAMLEGRTIKEQVESLMSPPLWPVTPETFGCVEYHDIVGKDIALEDVVIRTMPSNHLGGGTIYRFDGEEASIVAAFDFNHSDGYDEKLIEFAKGADTIIYDGCMSEEEYEIHPTWGHSTAEKGAEIAKEADVKRLIITHHGLFQKDDELQKRENHLKKKYPFLTFAKDGMRIKMDNGNAVTEMHQSIVKKDKLQTLLDIGIKLSAEKDYNKLFALIITAAMDVTGADGGTLYLLEDEALHFKIMITKSMNYYKGMDGEEIELPPVKLSKTNVCAAAVLQRSLINIPDVYHSDLFDFSGPRRYDKMTGYKTTSVMVAPMENNRGEIIGVLQLINATNKDGVVTEFDDEDTALVASIASQAAICVTNMLYSQQIKTLLEGFVRVMATGIDERTPYNANHTRNMVKYGSMFFDYEKNKNGKWNVSQEEREEILMSVWLHDLGKLITPLEIMDKSTRLGDSISEVEHRYKCIDLLTRLDASLTEEEKQTKIQELQDELNFIEEVNKAGFLPDEKLDRIQAIAKKTYVDTDGETYPYLTEIELLKLSIRKGTLTAEERGIMEGHASMTSKMLGELDFPKLYAHVPFYAGAHHEYINGKGYPNHLEGRQIPWQVHLITILDVFDALTARDRPYKPPMPTEKAFSILHALVEDGQMDGKILKEFETAWYQQEQNETA